MRASTLSLEEARELAEAGDPVALGQVDHITPDVMRVLLADPSSEDIERFFHLELGLTELDVSVARVIADWVGSELALPRLVHTTAEAMRALLPWEGTLTVRCVDRLGVALLEVLASRTGGSLVLGPIGVLDAARVRALTPFGGHLSLEGVTEIAPDAHTVLGMLRCASLRLWGLRQLSSEAAASLQVPIVLPDLIEIDWHVAAAVAGTSGPHVMIGGELLDVQAAKALASSRATSIDLLSATHLGRDVGEALADWPGRTLFFRAVPTIEPGAGAAFARWGGRFLHLPKLRALSGPDARGLVTSAREETAFGDLQEIDEEAVDVLAACAENTVYVTGAVRARVAERRAHLSAHASLFEKIWAPDKIKVCLRAPASFELPRGSFADALAAIAPHVDVSEDRSGATLATFPPHVLAEIVYWLSHAARSPWQVGHGAVTVGEGLYAVRLGVFLGDPSPDNRTDIVVLRRLRPDELAGTAGRPDDAIACGVFRWGDDFFGDPDAVAALPMVDREALYDAFAAVHGTRP